MGHAAARPKSHARAAVDGSLCAAPLRAPRATPALNSGSTISHAAALGFDALLKSTLTTRGGPIGPVESRPRRDRPLLASPVPSPRSPPSSVRALHPPVRHATAASDQSALGVQRGRRLSPLWRRRPRCTPSSARPQRDVGCVPSPEGAPSDPAKTAPGTMEQAWIFAHPVHGRESAASRDRCAFVYLLDMLVACLGNAQTHQRR